MKTDDVWSVFKDWVKQALLGSFVSCSLPRYCQPPKPWPQPSWGESLGFPAHNTWGTYAQRPASLCWRMRFKMTVSMRIHLPSSCFPIKAVLSKKDKLEKAVERAEALKLAGISISQLPTMWHWVRCFARSCVKWNDDRYDLEDLMRELKEMMI